MAGMVRNSLTHPASSKQGLLRFWQVSDVRKITWPACRHLVGSKIVNGNKWHVNFADFHQDTIFVSVRELKPRSVGQNINALRFSAELHHDVWFLKICCGESQISETKLFNRGKNSLCIFRSEPDPNIKVLGVSRVTMCR